MLIAHSVDVPELFALAWHICLDSDSKSFSTHPQFDVLHYAELRLGSVVNRYEPWLSLRLSAVDIFLRWAVSHSISIWGSFSYWASYRFFARLDAFNRLQEK